MRVPPLRLSALLVSVLGGCAETREINDLTSDGGVGDMVGIESGSDDGSDEAPLDGPKLDLGEESAATNCREMDFLFVIDNSGSMQDEQENLVASFDGFMDGIASTIGTADVHVMVVDTDGEGGIVECGSTDCCAALCASDPMLICNDQPCADLASEDELECGERLGAGRVTSSDTTECDALEDGRYLATSSVSQLDDAFSCVANVGTTGGVDERPVDAVRAALRMSEPTACNAGFLRDDALLVVTVVTDEDDLGSAGEPEDWAQDILAFKGGRSDLVVMLGLVSDSDLADPLCLAPYGTSGAAPAPRLRQFVSEFPSGRVGSVCAADYGPFFLESVMAIRLSCEGGYPVL